MVSSKGSILGISDSLSVFCGLCRKYLLFLSSRFIALRGELCVGEVTFRIMRNYWTNGSLHE